jgi:hypothetical protein
MAIESEVKNIEITYTNQKKDNILLVVRTINTKNNGSFNSIIEVIPKNVISDSSKVTFINKNSIIKEDPIFEISSNDINEGKIVYYISGGNYDYIEKIDTLAFKDDLLTNAPSRIGLISGFSVILDSMNKGIMFYFSWLVVVVLIIFIFIYYSRKKKIVRFRRNKDFNAIIGLLKSIKLLIEQKEIEIARQRYYEIKGLYGNLDDSMKKLLYEKILAVQLEIDKREISSLVNECILAIKEKRISDAKLVYSRIKPIYNRLPNKYKEKIYTRIIPFVK